MNTLIYITDPMCSWCYGFTNEITKIITHFKKDLQFEMIMGGLRPYNTETINELSSFLRTHWEHVEQRSGQPFNFDVLDSGIFKYDTEPPARAIITVRQLNPEKEFSFFKAVQKAFYYENEDTNLTSTYMNLASEFQIDQQEFEKTYLAEETKLLTKADFQKSAALGVRGFPTLLLKYKDGYTLISNGYNSAEMIIPVIENELQILS